MLSLRSPHPHLLPQNPKDYSIHLCLFFCLASSTTEYQFAQKPDVVLALLLWSAPDSHPFAF